MRKVALCLGVFVLGSAFAVGSAEAATFYVAKTGSDGNSCSVAQNVSTPKLTFGSAVTCLRPGDTLLVRAGTYDETLINNVPSGTSWTAKVRIAAYPGETVWLRPSRAAHVVNFYTTQMYIEFDGINIDGTYATHSCVKIEEWSGGQAHHIRVKNATLKGLNNDASGPQNLVIVTALRQGAIGSNEFINLTLTRDANNRQVNRTNGFYIQSPNNVIEWSHFYNLNGFAMQAYNGNPEPITLPHNNIVRYNRIHDFPVVTERTWGINIGRGTGNKIYGNLIYNIKGTGSGSAALLVFVGNNTEVYNNTVYGSATGGIVVESGASGTVVRNNITFQNAGGNFQNRGANTVSSNNLTSDPGFVNPSGGDFRVRAGSPAIDAGMAITAVAVDLARTPRPQGAAWDLGAYELTSTSTSPAAPTAPTDVRVISD